MSIDAKSSVSSWQYTVRDWVEKARICPIVQQALVITAVYDIVMAASSYFKYWKCQYETFQVTQFGVEDGKDEIDRSEKRLENKATLLDQIKEVEKELETSDTAYLKKQLERLKEEYNKIPDMANSLAEKRLKLEEDKKRLELAQKKEAKAQLIFNYHVAHLTTALRCTVPIYGSFKAHKWSHHTRREQLQAIEDAEKAITN